MFRLYKKTGKNLENKKEIDLKPAIFRNEDEMRDWIANNLDKILPSLSFLSVEYFIGKKFLDILALDFSKNSFVIIECKLGSESEISQLIGYVAKVKNAKKEEIDRLKGIAWDKHYSISKEYEAMNSDFFSLEETKIILIKSYFEDWVIELAKETSFVILAKIGAYEFKGEYYIYLDIQGKEGEELLKIDINKKEKEKSNQKKIKLPEPKEWEEWAKNEKKYFEKEYPSLTIKQIRGKINFKKKGATILDIYFKSYHFNPSKNLKLFLVNPTSSLIQKYNLISLPDGEDNTHEFLIDTEKENGFQEAHLLLLEFIKEKS